MLVPTANLIIIWWVYFLSSVPFCFISPSQPPLLTITKLSVLVAPPLSLFSLSLLFHYFSQLLLVLRFPTHLKIIQNFYIVNHIMLANYHSVLCLFIFYFQSSIIRERWKFSWEFNIWTLQYRTSSMLKVWEEKKILIIIGI